MQENTIIDNSLFLNNINDNLKYTHITSSTTIPALTSTNPDLLSNNPNNFNPLPPPTTTQEQNTHLDLLITNTKSKKNRRRKSKNNKDNSNNSNKNVIKINKTKENNNNNNNKQSKIYSKLIIYHSNYKKISPFQKYLELGQVPTIEDLTTEFYHILLPENCEILLKEVNQISREMGIKQSQDSKAKRRNQNVSNNEMQVDGGISNTETTSTIDSSNKIIKSFKVCSHHHTMNDIESVQLDSREKIEKAVRKICGFLEKESNMVLVEIILLSIGLAKSLEFLQSTLEIEKKGGIFMKKKPLNNTQQHNHDINNDNIERIKKTPGGVFFKLVGISVEPLQREMIFSRNSITKFIRERKRNPLHVHSSLPKVQLLQNSSTNSMESCLSLYQNIESDLYKDDEFDINFAQLNLND